MEALKHEKVLMNITGSLKRNNGKAGIAEYNDAKNNFLRAESELLRSRYECLFQVRLLDFYRGGDIVM